MDKEFYFTIEKTAQAQYRDRGSQFISFAFPIKATDDFKTRMAELKKEHPKATHHCFAYRLGLDNNTFRSSDAGEPAGTAGKPILGQIDSRELTDILIVVVRYFGGTLLGVPGLIQAYKSSASMVLQLVPVVKKPIEKKHHLLFDYSRFNEILAVLRQSNCSVISQELQLFCTMEIGVPVNRQQEVIYKLEAIPTVQVD
ncbi:MAG: YigZ family protein [Chitinophagaceae bacterium]